MLQKLLPGTYRDQQPVAFLVDNKIIHRRQENVLDKAQQSLGVRVTGPVVVQKVTSFICYTSVDKNGIVKLIRLGKKVVPDILFIQYPFPVIGVVVLAGRLIHSHYLE
jgi:hypothetical protein